jgi:hypothetical protein
VKPSGRNPYQYGVRDADVAQSGKKPTVDLRRKRTVPDDYEFSRALLLAVDAWRYGPRDGRQQFELQRHLSDAVSAAAVCSGLDRSRWQLQDAGDGFVAVLPDGAELALVDPFIRELDTWLSRHNHDRVQDARLRLRVAIHHGPVITAELGHAAAGLVDVSRLRDSRPVREALDAEPSANLVLAVSERIFEDVIRQRHTSLSTNDFARAKIADEEKAFHAVAWIRVPGARSDASVSHEETLALGVRILAPPDGLPAVVQRVLIPSLAALDVAPLSDDSFSGENPVVCLPGVSVQVVLGVWIDSLDKMLRAKVSGIRMVVGVCSMSDRRSARRVARELASSDTAARVLAGARGGRVVVIVSDHVHHMISLNPGRLVLPENYGPADESSWLRVPGHSMSPDPVEEVRETLGDGPTSGIASATATGRQGVAIGHGIFHEFNVGTVNRYDGRDR